MSDDARAVPPGQAPPLCGEHFPDGRPPRCAAMGCGHGTWYADGSYDPPPDPQWPADAEEA